MSYSARRGFSNGSMRPTGAQRQQEMQQKLQEMQEAMNRAQEDVEAKEFTATVGGGVVTATVNGKKVVTAISQHQARGRGPRGCGDAAGPGDLRRQRGPAPGGRGHGAEHGRRHRRTEPGQLRPVRNTERAGLWLRPFF